MKTFYLLLVNFFLLTGILLPQDLIINKKDAEVWSVHQTINGKLQSFLSPSGILYLNDTPYNFNVSQSDSTFSVDVILSEGVNTLIAQANYNSTVIYSDTLLLTLAFELLPEVFAYAEKNSSGVLLKGTIVENPKNLSLTFVWTADINNPAALQISSPNDTLASVSVPVGNTPPGEYYFNLHTITPEGDTVKARTFFTIYNDSIRVFDIKNDYAAWIDSAVLYEITPYIFVNNGKFNHITNKIPDLVRLGINTIWIQPIYSTFYRGQGYDVTDYFNVRPDLGTESDLRNLIQTAKANGLKVMFDFVANHSSIQHPYARNSVLYGEDSHYWDFYQRETNNAPYSQHYTFYQGFINYFWDDLPNLNFDNPEVRNWITRAAKYWVEKFDIDGYRFDAVWGVTARNPQFTKDLRIALKTIKPELLLLAEDKATQPQVFDERFDVAFDWMPEESWVSHWSWQTSYNPNANPTIFNFSSQNQRSALLRNAITNNGAGLAPDAKVLRFLGNNDLFYFNTHHGIARTKMAAALQFTIHGVPLLYNGEEIGKTGHPYSTEFIFFPGQPIDYSDPNRFFPYYQNLINLKKTLPALQNNNYSEITVSPSSYVFGFRRWEGNQNLFTILNMGASSTNVNISIPVTQLNLDSTSFYYMTDLLSGEIISGTLNELASISTTMDMFSAKIYFLADSIFLVSTDEHLTDLQTPKEFSLSQNYPNPFNPVTNIVFSIPDKGEVDLRIYDILGSEVAVLLNEEKEKGEHTVKFNASDLPSGVYLYRITYNGYSTGRKMIILK
jgi:cyclomaltodextrinase / maltogenic alpha-amylase / neopullulanase